MHSKVLQIYNMRELKAMPRDQVTFANLLANPDSARAQKVRLTDRSVNQQIPSGTVDVQIHN